MALLNLNTLLVDHALQTAPFMRARVAHADKKNLAHLFSDAHLTVTRANPVAADGTGAFPLCHLMEGTYCVLLSAASGRALGRIDIRLVEETDAADLGESHRYRFGDLSRFTADTLLSYDTDPGRIQVAAGDSISVNDTARTYRVAPQEADDAQIETQGGVRFYINQNRYDINAEAWGVKLTGADEDARRNAEIMRAAVTYLHEGGGGRITLGNDGHLKIDACILMRPGVSIDGRGAVVDNILTRHPGDGTNFGEDCTFYVGALAGSHSDDHTWHPLTGITAGADEAVLADPATVADFQVGDIVWLVEANASWGTGAKVFPDQSEIARIAEISGSTLRFEHHNTLTKGDVPAGTGTIASTASGAWIANVDWRVSAGKGFGDLPDQRHVSKDVALYDMCLQQSGQDGTENTSPVATLGGCYNFDMERIRVLGSVANALFTNGLVRSRWHDITTPYTRRAIEIKYLSQDSVLSDIHTYKRNIGFAPDFEESPPITIGEKARHITVNGLWADMGKWNDDGSNLNLIAFSQAEHCRVRNFFIKGTAPFATCIGFPTDAEHCTVENGDIFCPASVLIEDSGLDCTVRDVSFHGAASSFAYRRNGTARGGHIRGNTFHHSAPVKTVALAGTTPDRAVIFEGNRGISGFDLSQPRAIVPHANTGADWDQILSAGARMPDLAGASTSSTSEVALGAALVIPAGLMQVGDVFTWHVTGECIGSAGARWLSWRAAVDTDDDTVLHDPDDDANAAGNIALPGTCMDWRLDVSATVISATRIVTEYVQHDLTNGTVTGTVTRHVNADFANHATLFQLSGRVADSADSLVLRVITRDAQRMGFL